MTEEMIVEAIRSVRMSQADQMQALGNAAAPEGTSPAAVERFQAAMAADAPARVDAVPFADELSAVWRSAQVHNQEMLHRVRALSELNRQGGVSAASLLQLQYEVANLTFQQEVVSKVADKSSNAVQTLIKNQ